MESNDKLKEIDIKYRACYYFDDIIKIEDFDLNNILIDEKSYENILVYNDGFVRVYDRSKYLVLFGSEKYDYIYDRIRYLRSVKSGITNIFSHNYAEIKVGSYDFFTSRKNYIFS